MEVQKRENPSSQFWKKSLEQNFNDWISGLECSPENIEPQEEPAPDLYSFYAELCALKSEIHRNAKRNHDAYAGFKETLSQFDQTLRTLTKEQLKLVGGAQSQKSEEARQRAFRLAVVDLYERFKRVEAKLANPPRRGIFFSAAKWQASWEALREGFVILGEHFKNLLAHEGIQRMKCKDRPFDPNCMKAVDFELIDTMAPNTVMEELSGGYFYQKRVLKYAEVKVAVAKGDL